MDLIMLLAGVALAGPGGELFLRGTVGIARWARVSPGIIGVTVAAFATSSPELSVAISSAAAGKPEISLGDALGSNVVNIALVLGCALAISGIRTPRGSIRRDFPFAVVVPLVTGVLMLDGRISRFDGLLLLAMFAGWMFLTLAEAMMQRGAARANDGGRAPRGQPAAILCATGLALLVAAGALIVAGARGLAAAWGVGEYVIGAAIVSVGTSVPELATTVIAKLRGHDDIGLGTILGSNIFNNAFIVAVAAIICPIPVARAQVAATLVFGLAAVAIVYPRKDGLISRRRGAMLLALYAAYLVFIV